MYKVVDLFAGAGGLSLGFMQNGHFDIKVAFENNPHMQDTYRRNHPGVEVLGDVCKADFKKLKKKYDGIDVVIGGPPCQGFSNANRQKNTAINHNNMLVKQYIRAVVELKPKAFVMENVSMLKSDVHRFFLDESDVEKVVKYKIPTSETKLILLDKEHYIIGAEKIVNNSKLISKYIWNENDYFLLNIIYKATRNNKKFPGAMEKHEVAITELIEAYSSVSPNSEYGRIVSVAFETLKNYYTSKKSALSVKKAIEPVVMFQRMLFKLQEIIDNKIVVDRIDNSSGIVAIIKSYSVFDYLTSILGSAPNNYQITSDVLCAADYGAPQKRRRFVVVGIRKPQNGTVYLPEPIYAESEYRTVKDAIYDLQSVSPCVEVSADKGIELGKIKRISDLGEQLRDSRILYNHIVTKTRPVALERFKMIKPGQNFHSLDTSLKINTYTDVNRTQNTIYLRLDYRQPCGTVVNVRKSMWIHPKLDRAISIREAARLQTFPDSFVFCGTKDKQYQQVGNAVPPIMAKAIADSLAEQLC